MNFDVYDRKMIEISFFFCVVQVFRLAFRCQWRGIKSTQCDAVLRKIISNQKCTKIYLHKYTVQGIHAFTNTNRAAAVCLFFIDNNKSLWYKNAPKKYLIAISWLRGPFQGNRRFCFDIVSFHSYSFCPCLSLNHFLIHSYITFSISFSLYHSLSPLLSFSPHLSYDFRRVHVSDKSTERNIKKNERKKK